MHRHGGQHLLARWLPWEGLKAGYQSPAAVPSTHISHGEWHHTPAKHMGTNCKHVTDIELESPIQTLPRCCTPSFLAAKVAACLQSLEKIRSRAQSNRFKLIVPGWTVSLLVEHFPLSPEPRRQHYQEYWGLCNATLSLQKYLNLTSNRAFANALPFYVHQWFPSFFPPQIRLKDRAPDLFIYSHIFLDSFILCRWWMHSPCGHIWRSEVSILFHFSSYFFWDSVSHGTCSSLIDYRYLLAREAARSSQLCLLSAGVIGMNHLAWFYPEFPAC